MSMARTSDDPAAGFDRDHETAIELFYGFAPAPWIRVKPDVQLVLNPGGTSQHGDALVLGLRTTLSL